MILNSKSIYGLAISVFVLAGLMCFGAQATALKDSIHVKNPKHQVGIGINKFVKFIFPIDQNAFLLEYRYNIIKDCYLRSAVNFDINTQENKVFQGGLKAGFDFQLVKSDNWYFYIGADIFCDYLHLENINRDFYGLGIIALLGIQYRINKNFSICLEPNVFIRSNIKIDHSTFSRENKSQWYQSGLGKIGYIQLNFHL
jgi:hypothetical protein